MDLNQNWDLALKNTQIIRSRIQSLLTFSDTRVSYIMLSESTFNNNDTVVRKGEVLVQRPALILPPHFPQLEGFEFQQGLANEDSIVNFLLVRGVSLPSLKYNHVTHSLDLHESRLSKAIDHYEEILQKKEDVSTGLIAGPSECWQFSVLIFICTQIAKNANQDIKKIIDQHRKKNENE